VVERLDQAKHGQQPKVQLRQQHGTQLAAKSRQPSVGRGCGLARWHGTLRCRLLRRVQKRQSRFEQRGQRGQCLCLALGQRAVKRRVERGHLNIAVTNAVASNFMLDTVYYRQAKTGTSSYSGRLVNLGLHFQQKHYSIGISVKPSMTLTRTWDREVSSIDSTRKSFPFRIDSARTRTYSESGTDDLKYPLSYTLGIVVMPTDRWTIAFDYDVRNLGDAELTSSASGTTTHPWVSKKAALRIGAEFRADDMLALRGGYREDMQAFSPDGAAISDEPARGGIYSFGAGITLGNILVDVAYEYSLLKYHDIYQSNVNYNMREQHQFMMDVAYRF